MAKIGKRKPKKTLWINLLLLVGVIALLTLWNPNSKVDTSKVKNLPGSFEWVVLKANQSSGPYTCISRKIFGGDVGCGKYYMMGIDKASFEVYTGSSYSRDKNHIYFPRRILCVENYECSACYPTKYIVEKADLSSFQIAFNNPDYAWDKKYIYLNGVSIDSFCMDIP